MKIFKPRLSTLLLLAGMGATATSQGALYSRLGGLAVYDDDFNITWLADANANGAMNWTAANAWATGLNIGGYTGWRLPNADPVCGNAYNCINSEMGHLYYTELGVTAGNPITSSTSHYLQLFTNVQNGRYWTGTEYALNQSLAWGFFPYDGTQNNGYLKTQDFDAWAVRNGDIGDASVPEPGIFGLIAIGGMAWTGIRRKQRG